MSLKGGFTQRFVKASNTAFGLRLQKSRLIRFANHVHTANCMLALQIESFADLHSKMPHSAGNLSQECLVGAWLAFRFDKILSTAPPHRLKSGEFCGVWARLDLAQIGV
jgi:hypothetical protein